MHAKVTGLDKLANPHLMMYLADSDDEVIVIPVRKDSAGKWRISGKWGTRIPAAEFNDFADFLKVQGNRVLSRDLKKMREMGVPLIAVSRGGSDADAYSAAAWLVVELLRAGE